jgi:hypothetical protein
MKELKPEADVPLWAYSGIQAKCTEPVPVTTFGQNTASTMWIIPDTHRIVPVEDLIEIRESLIDSGKKFMASEVQAIIDKEQGK